MNVAYLTAGAGGMFCGSCMRDNTLVSALTSLGLDAVLVPTYTPIRTDGDDVSIDQVFFGGINVYLQQKLPFLRWLPTWFDQFLNRPGLIRWATKGGMQTSPQQLGALAVSMLQGMEGRQRKEVRRLCDWLRREFDPDVVMLSNLLIGGCVPELKRRLDCRVYVTLQGDDIFLNDLIEPYKARALAQLRKLVRHVDGFLVNSRYYANYMGELLEIPADKLHVTPLGIDLRDAPAPTWTQAGTNADAVARAAAPTIGFLARLAPEKGLHRLVDAFIHLRERHCPAARLKIAGWLGPQHRSYAEEQLARLDEAGLGDAYECVGEVDRQAKQEFLRSIDVLTVPTVYHEPKGLYVLEALASGVPVVQPSHGAFPELLASTGGGLLVPPDDPAALASSLASLLNDPDQRHALAVAGYESVVQRHSAEAMAEATWRIISAQR
ncbi:MAG: glycosyltransferase family 4 protein [Planctomycetales bacterium]|nr:glycosyltransferase family 4 protein [Planctomycetales bacterium]